MELPHNKIIQGDCLEILKSFPSQSIDLIVTDPPYNMAYSGRGKINLFDNFENDDLPESEHSAWFDDILSELYRVLKDNAGIYIYIDFRNYARIYPLVKKYFDIKNCIVWDKESIGMGQCFRFQHEFCIYAQKGTPVLNFEKKNIGDVWRFKREIEEYQHPTQKPLYAMYMPIVYSSKVGDIILDPFVGSGTTAMAAKQLGRRYIGIEISDKYCEVARQRVGMQQLPMF